MKGRKAAAEPQRARRARAMADLLPAAGGAAFRRFGFVQSSIVSRWREIVGARYAAVSAPESIRFPPGRKSAGTLTLVVEGAHAPMLQHVAPVIQERVNQFFGYEAVARVAIRQGLVQVEKRKSRAAQPSPAGRAVLLANLVGFGTVALNDVWGVASGEARELAKVFLIVHALFALAFAAACWRR